MNIHTVARICSKVGLFRLAYFLNRNRKRIITFHNVLSDDVYVKNVANGVSCSLSQFKTIVETVGKRFGFSLDLNDPKTVTVTFDDGYANQASVAAPVLISKRIPAYLFVSGQLLDITKGELTIDKLLHWVSYAPEGDYHLAFNDKSVDFKLDDSNRQKVWSKLIWPAFIEDIESKGSTLLGALNMVYPYEVIRSSLSERYINQRLEGVTAEQIAFLKSNGWEIGWHTYSHYPVSLLAPDEKQRELSPLGECDSSVMSFPYGGISDVDNESIEIVRQSGFDSALSNINLVNEHSGNYYRSRMSLPADPLLIDFELSGLKYFLKYRKLLPKI